MIIVHILKWYKSLSTWDYYITFEYFLCIIGLFSDSWPWFWGIFSALWWRSLDPPVYFPNPRHLSSPLSQPTRGSPLEGAKQTNTQQMRLDLDGSLLCVRECKCVCVCTGRWGLSASYSPSCMAVAILFMVAMTALQDWRRHSYGFRPWAP